MYIYIYVNEAMKYLDLLENATKSYFNRYRLVIATVLAVSFYLKLQRMFYLLFITSQGKCNHMNYAIKNLTSLVKTLYALFTVCANKETFYLTLEKS